MKQRKEKTLSEKIWDKTGLSFWCDWLQIFPIKQWNWINIRFICFDVEWDKMGNELCVEIALLGFNIRWQLNLDFINGGTEQSKELFKRVKEIDKKLMKKIK